MSEAQPQKNIWEENLEKKTLVLKNCQQEKNLQSCFVCQKVIDCQNRKDYVKAVYDSMSKGQSGSFEF